LFPPEFRPVWLPATLQLKIEQVISRPGCKPAPAFGGVLARALAKLLDRRALCTLMINGVSRDERTNVTLNVSPGSYKVSVGA
jgi:hypothetical protein